MLSLVAFPAGVCFGQERDGEDFKEDVPQQPCFRLAGLLVYFHKDVKERQNPRKMGQISTCWHFNCIFAAKKQERFRKPREKGKLTSALSWQGNALLRNKKKKIMANSMGAMPPATKNLLIINCIVLMAQMALPKIGLPDLTNWFGLHFILADNFHIWQPLTYMFLHGGLSHLFFNMFALWMFGVVIERTIGTRRFLIYYFVCGLGAALMQEIWQLAQYYIEGMYNYHFATINRTLIPMGQYLDYWTTIGASGAVYGVLLAFGYLYPNERIMLLIPPIPLKARYLVIGYIVIEALSLGMADNIAHFAHLGGMLFGWMLLRYWKKQYSHKATFGYGQTHESNKPSLWQRLMKRGKKQPDITISGGRAYNGHTSDYDYNLQKKQHEEELDRILEKISQSGYDNLTREEKDFLFRNSQK